MGMRERLRWSSAIALVLIGRTAFAAPPAAAPTPAPANAAAPAAAPTPAPANAAPPAASADAPAVNNAAPAPAAASTAPAKKLSPAAALRAANTALASASASEVRQGLLALAELSGDAPARALAERMRAGLPPALIGDAIAVAVRRGSPRAIPALSELLQHKRPAVRKHALTALTALKAKTAQAAMLAALDDPDVEVRRAALDALAELKVTRALPQLLALVGRNQPGALQAVGKLAGARDMAAMLAQAPGGDVTPLKPALQAWLADERRMPAQQLELIAAMTKVASPSARTYLVEWLDAAKSASNPKVRTALFAAIKQLDDAGASGAKTTRTIVQGVKVDEPAAPAPASSPPLKNEPANQDAEPRAARDPRKGGAPTAPPAGREGREPFPLKEIARAETPPAAGTAVSRDQSSASRAGGAR